MKINFKYCKVSVDVDLVPPDGWEVNPHEIVMKIAELAKAVEIYKTGHIKITVDGGADQQDPDLTTSNRYGRVLGQASEGWPSNE